MPPKGGKPEVIEDEGPRTYADVTVSCICQLEANADGSAWPQLFLSVLLAPDKEPVLSEPASPDEKGNVSLMLAITLVRRPGDVLLHQLLNAPLAICVCRKDTGKSQVAASVDLLAFGSGASQVQAEAQLVAEPGSADGASGLAFTATPVVSTKVALLRLREGAAEPVLPPPAPAKAGKNKEVEVPSIPPAVDLEAAALLGEAEVAGSQVVELDVQQAGGLPNGLNAAMQAAGNALTFSCSLIIPGPSDGRRHTLTCPGATLTDGQLMWGSRPARFWLPAAAVSNLKVACELRSPLMVELARYLLPGNDNLTDPAFELYHGVGSLDVAEQLLEPGRVQAEGEAACSASFLGAQQAGRLATPALLPPEAPLNAKAKPIEEAAPLGEGAVPPCAWQQAGTRLRLALRLAQPFFPPWQPPPVPQQSLRDLIPARDLTKKVEPVTAQQEYRAQVLAIARSLATEYAKEAGPGADPAARQADLVFELNRSGAYLAIKGRLKRCVVGVVREKYRKTGKLEKDALQALYNELYVYLMAEMHQALLELAPLSLPPAPPGSPDAARLAALLGLAGEAEVCGDLLTATRRHQERLLAASDPQVWYDYGTFCLRTQRLGPAEESLREVVALDSGHLAALLALACLLWHNALATDPAFFQQAEVVLQQAQSVAPASPLVWALLSLVFAGGGEARAGDARNSSFEARRLAKAEATPRQANAFLQAALLLLDLQLGTSAQQALQLAASPPDNNPALASELALCRSRAASLVGDEAAALAHITEAARGAEPSDARPHILLGNIHYSAGRQAEASSAYQAALRTGPDACPLELYLRLGASFLEQGQPEYARNVYVQACAVRPCASAWLGAGLAYLRLGDLTNADLALTEANILDNQNARIWGYLALLSLLAGREAEAEQALKWGLKQGLADAALLAEIGSTLMAQGRYAKAVAALERSVAAGTGPN
ncbi:hypothetical protein WJX72_004242 [[Myrmecia] bisecta]|uniref:Uncharacterized protein n=1 Tax=[Myrmecia] bisecta TaxID=41462 RepID=A0AAW1QEU8_9CHLO